MSILDFKIKNTQPVLLQFNKSEMQDRTYLVSEKLARGNTSSAKHSGTPVPTDTGKERNTFPEPQQLVMLCGMGVGLASASQHPPACQTSLRVFALRDGFT